MEKNLTVAGFLRNASVSDVDLRHPERGNPGVGGTQFGFVSLAYYLQKFHGDHVRLTLYAQSTDQLPSSVRTAAASTPLEAVEKAAADDCDMILLRIQGDDPAEEILDRAEAVGLPVLIWAQNFPWRQLLDEVASRSIVKRLICVGQQELDRHRDHPAFRKSRCIFNGIDPETYAPPTHDVGDGNTVVYLGSLIEAKGFHRLARVWPKIHDRVPEAKLVVIGSGALYDRGAQLGKWGVASEAYEQRFRSYLSSSNGAPHPSVTFKGNMGDEKIPLLQTADVGVANPTGATETFCWSAVEFQASGTPVVAADSGGLRDTVQDRSTGILVRSDDEVEEAVVRLLRSRGLRERFGQEAMRHVTEKFSFDVICDEWLDLFDRVGKKLDVKSDVERSRFANGLKDLIRSAKTNMPIFKPFPTIFEMSRLLKRGLKGGKE